MKTSTSILGAVWAAGLVSALTPAEWRSQSIYQVLTDRFARTDGSTTAACNVNLYCNGTFQGIINQLDYIQDMGFTAIWISPVVKNLEGDTPDGSSYHGYWAQDIYAINPHYGTSDDLKALSNALHKRDMYLMVDVVTNHMGYKGCGNCVDYSVFNPFNQQSYYHPYCPIDYNNQTSIVDCWEGDNIVSLPDLRTEDANVQAIWGDWIKSLIKNYTIDGLRVDSAQQTGTFFFAGFEAAAGIYMVGEDFNGDPVQACKFQNYMDGILNYPLYFNIIQGFGTSTGSMSNIVNGIAATQADCKDTTLLGSFSENHDNPRFPAGTEDIVRAMNVITFTILQDGIPIIYQGQEQHLNGSGVPVNREAIWLTGYNTTSPLYKLITTVNGIRKVAIDKSANFVTDKIQAMNIDANTIMTRKGDAGSQIVGVYSNLGENGHYYDLSLPASQTGFTPNEKIVEVLSCTLLSTDGTGSLVVPMGGGLPKVLFPYAHNVDICKQHKSATATSAPTPTCGPASILFEELVNTTYGQSVVVTGDIPSLGNWNPGNAPRLSANNYTAAKPLWYGTVGGIDPEAVIQYKYVIINTDGSYHWESDPNHTYLAPAGCTPTATVMNTFQS